MDEVFSAFEKVVRKAHLFSDEEIKDEPVTHLFGQRSIHPTLPTKVRSLFDDGHFAQASFEAFNYLDREVARIAKQSVSGFKLMMAAFADQAPAIRLNKLVSESDKDEQKGFQFLFSGAVLAVRNPRGHEYALEDTVDECLDHLALVSMLIRRMEKAGYKLKQ